MNERRRIELLGRVFGAPSPGVSVGIGDDAAVFAPGTHPLVWTVDAQVEHVHFERAWLSWEDVGFRSFMAAASDLAAMGAEPVAALSALVLPPSVDDAALSAIAHGQAAAASDVGAPVIGGNLARGSELSVTTTLVGRAAAPLLRSGARPGDGLHLAGCVGLAAAGLAALLRGDACMQDARIAPALAAWRRPRARIAEGRGAALAASRGEAHAAVDVSDGLACDVAHLADASDVAVVLDAAAVVASGGDDLARAAAVVGRDALELCLDGGEDYALVVASSADLPGFRRIGTVVARGERGEGRLYVEDARGLRPIEPRGFDHFAPRP